MLDVPQSGARDRMVDLQIRGRGISDSNLLTAMRQVPRHLFVDPEYQEFAYQDTPLPIGEGQTISQPYIVAHMIEAAEVQPGDRVLEIGAGSGYSAAVMSRIAASVYAIERHASLGSAARRRFEELNYDNLALRIGDGTVGWLENAPYDAILVTAGGPAVPETLKQQLAIHGRLVMPVGSTGGQTLLKMTRTGETEFRQEELGAVRFVPLVGEHGWTDRRRRSTQKRSPAERREPTPPELIRDAAEPLPEIENRNFPLLFDRFGARRIVLLGEATHGTAEFYRARAAITRRLIEQHGFTIVAVEADWPDAATVDRYVRLRPPLAGAPTPFQRFPMWMWRNTEIAKLIDWLRAHNEAVDQGRRAGFYGLDLYNMSASIAAVLGYLDRVDPEAATIARERYGCLTPWQTDPSAYGRAVLSAGYRKCEAAVVDQCRELLRKRLDYESEDGDSFLDAAQNARLISSAERYYREMYYGGGKSWNLRDSHMFETLGHLLEAHGPDSKAVVWAHNSHIGDARFTEMGVVREELNLGQLCRERFGADAALIGFGTHTGTVAAATDWDGEMEVKRLTPSHSQSYENFFHDAGLARFLLDFGDNETLQRDLTGPHLERFVGVVYRPETELASHYTEASLPHQFDAYVWFDETQALTPIGPEHRRTGLPDTYPFGL